MTFPAVTFEQLMEIFERILPRSYTYPLLNEADGQGADVYRQLAQQFARASEAVALTTQGYYLLPNSQEIDPPAAGASQATGVVRVQRPVGSSIGAVTVPQGTLFEGRVQGSYGQEVTVGFFQSTAPATLGSGDLGPITIPVECTRPGPQGNVIPFTITRFKELSAATVVGDVPVGFPNVLQDNGVPDRFTGPMLGQYVRFISGPNVGAIPRRITEASLGQVVVDGPALLPGPMEVEVLNWDQLGLEVSQPDPLEGGVLAWLDAIGAERGQVRAAGETDDEFRVRLNQLPDVVSPGAIVRIIQRTLGPGCVTWRFQEAGSPSLPGMFFDVSAWDAGDWDNGWLIAPIGSWFIVRVGPCNAGEFGFAFDADPFAPEDNNAWSSTPPLAPAVSFFDGFPLDFYTRIGALWNALNAARAAGVQFWIVLDETLPPCGTECC